MGVAKALFIRRARTCPGARDPEMRGRTYAIPFVAVWNAALSLADGGLKGWEIVGSDDLAGVIEVDATSRALSLPARIVVSVGLDADAQTRVDLEAEGRHMGGDLGVNVRRIKRFVRALDELLSARPGQTPGAVLAAPAESTRRESAVLAPTLAAALLLLPAGCYPGEDAGGPADRREGDGDAAVAPVIESGETYLRTVLFMDTSRDTSMFVQWEWEARLDSGGVRRTIRGWLGRVWSTPALGDDVRDGGSWDHFATDAWTSRHVGREWWRIRPRGWARLVMGPGNVLQEVYYRQPDEDRFLSVALGEAVAEWRGRRGERYQVLRGKAVLADMEMDGLALDVSVSRSASAEGPAEWALLAGADSLVVLLVDPEGPGPHRAWALRGLQEMSWSEVRAEWTEATALDGNRRMVPVKWQLASDDGELRGHLEATKSSILSLAGAGLLSTLVSVQEVAGEVTVEGAQIPVRGFLRHAQR